MPGKKIAKGSCGSLFSHASALCTAAKSPLAVSLPNLLLAPDKNE